MRKDKITSRLFWPFLLLALGSGWKVTSMEPHLRLGALQWKAVRQFLTTWSCDPSCLPDVLVELAPEGASLAVVLWHPVFTFALVGLMWTAIVRYTKLRGRWLISFGSSLLVLPVAAGALDLVEVSLMLDLRTFGYPTYELVKAIAWVAAIKWVPLLLTLLAVLVAWKERVALTRREKGQPKDAASEAVDDASDESRGPELDEKLEGLAWVRSKMPDLVEAVVWNPQEKPAPPDKDPLEWETVHMREENAIGDPPEAVGLAFSGGGIRSGTFNLGILQALANCGGLEKIHYLSTVSGGGYIGSWLAKWVSEAGVKNVQYLLRESGTHQTGEASWTEPPPIAFLRRYSNYLTPKTGLFSADTWTTVATFLRNVLLNQVILVSGAFVLLMLPRLIGGLYYPDRKLLADSSPWWSLGIGLALTLVAILCTVFNLSFFEPAALKGTHLRGWKRFTSQGWTLRSVVVPLTIASVFASYWLHRVTPGREPAGLLVLESFFRVEGWPDAAQWIVFMALLYAAAWWLGMLPGWLLKQPARLWARSTPPCVMFWGRFWGVPKPPIEAEETSAGGRLSGWKLVGWGLLAGAAGGGLLWLFKDFLNVHESGASVWRVVVFGPPLVLTIMTLIAVVHIGLLGTHLRTGRREWMARVGAWLLIVGGSWIVLAGVAVYGPVLIASANGYVKVGLASGWVASTLGGILMGKSANINGGAEKNWISRTAQGVAPYVFILGLIALLALGLDAFLTKVRVGQSYALDRASEATWQAFWAPGSPEASWLDRLQPLTEIHNELLLIQSRSVEPLIMCLVFALVCLLMARRVDINDYSMHHFYRNRLIRCYLGASELDRDRTAHPFTGFNPNDDVSMSELTRRPYLIVNTALNLVDERTELAWQERKAASFTLTPLHCGFALPGALEHKTFRPTEFYAAKRRAGDATGPDEQASGGVSLGTAMAISGAAVSPNMGYHSSPALTFLLTVFNVRLGWWLGNPRANPLEPHSWEFAGPRFGLYHLLAELLGHTSSQSDYVYLSDGGHFENIGIYELVRRRCKVIIACDCGADSDRKFPDLGNAIRKCRVDHGAEITFDNPIDRETGSPMTLGTIRYPDDTTGRLVYIKPTLKETEPEDVRSYKEKNGHFPQQTTGDQWFDEAQFESYRELGYTIGSEVFGTGFEEFITSLERRSRGGERKRSSHPLLKRPAQQAGL